MMNRITGIAGMILIAVGCTLHTNAQKKKPVAKSTNEDTTLTIRKGLTDEQLLDLVQKQTFRYFWDFGHPVSGMARERSNRTDYGDEVVTIGGTGFGVMSIIVAVERKWITRQQAVERLLKMI